MCFHSRPIASRGCVTLGYVFSLSADCVKRLRRDLCFHSQPIASSGCVTLIYVFSLSADCVFLQLRDDRLKAGFCMAARAAGFSLQMALACSPVPRPPPSAGFSLAARAHMSAATDLKPGRYSLTNSAPTSTLAAMLSNDHEYITVGYSETQCRLF